MMVSGAIAQPTSNSTLQTLEQILAAGPMSHLDVAAAYVTTGGALDLINTLKGNANSNWSTAAKRWIVSFDYCRTEPVALKMIANIPNSEVRIHDAERLIRQLCTPKVPFHPKMFLCRGSNRHVGLTGSGNISRSGLNTGFEAGLYLDISNPTSLDEINAQESLNALQSWFGVLWGTASPLTNELLNSYQAIFESIPKMKMPAATEDDIISGQLSVSSISSDDLIKLRVCRHLWIEAGNITKNLGPAKPGNQLMMKRLSRVYFGVPASDVPHNSPLKVIEVSYDGTSKFDCSLTFSDNGMDKLTLPSPGVEGPPFYDGQNLLFTRLSAGRFKLELGNSTQRRGWMKRSSAINASFAMPSGGRKWGVF